jgi:hypothetical protein
MSEGRHQLVEVTVAATTSRGTARTQATVGTPAQNAMAIATIHGVASWQAKRRGAGLVGTLGPPSSGRKTAS